MAQPRTRSTQIVWSDIIQSQRFRFGFDDVPDCFRSNAFSPNLAVSVDTAKDAALCQRGGCRPFVDCNFDPTWQGYRTDVPAFSD